MGKDKRTTENGQGHFFRFYGNEDCYSDDIDYYSVLEMVILMILIITVQCRYLY